MKTGINNGAYVEVTSGLLPSSLVVATYSNNLTSGQQVDCTNSERRRAGYIGGGSKLRLSRTNCQSEIIVEQLEQDNNGIFANPGSLRMCASLDAHTRQRGGSYCRYYQLILKLRHRLPGRPLLPERTGRQERRRLLIRPLLACRLNPGPDNVNGGPISPGSELTLKQAIAIALKYHPRLQEAADNTNAAQQQIGQARSYLGPQLFGAAQYLRSTTTALAIQLTTMQTGRSREYRERITIFHRMTPRKVGTPTITTWAASCSPSFLSTLAAAMDLFRSASSRPPPRPPINSSPSWI